MKHLLTVGLTLLFLATSASATEFNLPAFADGSIYDAGALGLSTDTTSSTVTVSRSGNSNIRHGVFLFDLTNIPENFNVQSLDFETTLSLGISNTSDSALVEFHGFNANDTITISDYDSPPSNVGSRMAAVEFETSNTGVNLEDSPLQISFDTTPIQSAIDRGDEVFMVRAETVNFVTFQVHSLENQEAMGVPTLVLNAVADADFNGDNAFDCQDVDSLVAEIVNGTNRPQFDLSDDGIVDQADLTEWLVQAGAANLPSGGSYKRGDANLDGSVDVTDFNVWNSNKFTNVSAWCSGDFDANGAVDVSDFNMWNDNKFTSADSLAAVPEPATSLMGIMAILGLVGATRCRK